MKNLREIMGVVGIMMAVGGGMTRGEHGGTGRGESVGAPPAAEAEVPIVTQGSLYLQMEGTPLASLADPSAPPSSVAATSMIAVQAPQPKKYKKHDLVTVIIREDSDASTTAKAASKKTQDFDVALQQFLALNAFGNGVQQIGNVANANKLPEVKFKYNNDRQSDATQVRADQFSARITAEVVDVKPNGTLVVEATKQIKQDNEEQTFKLSGTCRAEDVAADNTVLSTQLAELRFMKSTKGEVRDGTKRGWMNAVIDVVSPF